MVVFNLTIEQAVHNAEILHYKNVVFTSNKNGDINFISNMNVFGRFFNFIKNLIDGSREHKVNKAILATFEAINQYAKNHLDKPIWTYSFDQSGKDFDVGFDKVAMRVLLDYSRFSGFYYRSSENKQDDTRVKIRKVAYEVFLMATEQRKKEGIDFDCDHIEKNF